MLDAIIFVFLLIFCLLGFFKGHTKELKSIITLFIFFPLSYFHSSDIGSYFLDKINFDFYNFPSNIDVIAGALLIYFFIVFSVYLLSKYFFVSFIPLENVFFSKITGMFLGLIKGIILISYSIIVIIYYDYLDYIYDFDKNSLFLDYFLKFGVQLQDVWNHWYS